MIELLNVESAKSGKITADEACRRVSIVYTPLSLRGLSQGFAPTPQMFDELIKSCVAKKCFDRSLEQKSTFS